MPSAEASAAWNERQKVARAAEREPRGWTGFRVGPESGLTPFELDALRRAGVLEGAPDEREPVTFSL